MKTVYSYVRLTIAAWMFLGGLALQWVPSTAAVERDGRWRARLAAEIPPTERASWLEEQDRNDARAEAHLRMFGILFGGVGFAMALFETAHVCARASRHCPLDTL